MFRQEYKFIVNYILKLDLSSHESELHFFLTIIVFLYCLHKNAIKYFYIKIRTNEMDTVDMS